MLPVSRAVGWAVLGLFVGAGEGVRARSPKTHRRRGARAAWSAASWAGSSWSTRACCCPWAPRPRLIGLVVLGLADRLLLRADRARLVVGVLRVLNGRLKGKEFLVNQRRMRIGRSRRNEIALPGYEDLAERQAEIRLRGARWC